MIDLGFHVPEVESTDILSQTVPNLKEASTFRPLFMEHLQQMKDKQNKKLGEKIFCVKITPRVYE